MSHKLTLRLSLLFIFTSASLTGCRQEQRWFPLEAGRTWVYRVGCDSTPSQTMALACLPQQEFRDRIGIPIKYSLAGRDSLEYYNRDLIGLYTFARQSPEQREPDMNFYAEYLLPKTIKPGSSWVMLKDFPLRRGVTLRIACRVESLHETVATPAGTFPNCLKITGFGSAKLHLPGQEAIYEISSEFKRWYARDVGLVKSEESHRGGDLGCRTLELELESYQK